MATSLSLPSPAAPATHPVAPHPDADRTAWPALALRLRPLAVLCLGAGLGLWATAATLTHRFDPAAIRNGPWTTWPNVGTASIDPYARAIQARSGEIALVAAEGVMFVADRDSAGAPLSGRCTYRVSGPLPYARLWTLGLDTASGEVVDNAARRHAFTSTGIVRRQDGSFTIEVSSVVRPGNWLPAPADSPFILVLRLYETPLGTTPAELGAAALPTIAATDCAG
ncbi:MAG TPA: DUF1214 domain-containing protein [Lichenihabitans sp.]|jgi:hypothetical protein|nr:DUF1214 domain-containing protein [Lichenihabitans sp.]